MAQSCPQSLARVQPICASWPNCGRVPTKPCTTTNRAVHNEYPSRSSWTAESRARLSRASRISLPDRRVTRSSEPCVTNNRAARPPDPCVTNRRATRTSEPYSLTTESRARNVDSTVHTPEYTHSLVQVTLNLLCSTHSDMNNLFCFWLYISGVSARLTMWDISQFLFFFLFSSNFLLT